jgi:hypothetical protein
LYKTFSSTFSFLIFKTVFMDKNKNLRDENQSRNQNGIVTVNDNNNPTPEQRDAYIPNEPGTERLRSERQSVRDGEQNIERGTEE